MNQPRILVVEDEGIVAADIQQCLKRMGYAASTVASGLEALRRIPDLTPDLILMDIILPGGMDGIEAALQLRRKYEIPVIFLTAHADEATLARAKTAEPSGYIIKPFEEKGLHTIIELVLHKRRMDLSDRRHAEHERQLLTFQLRQSQKLESIGKLAAGILHEINTPAQYFRDNTRFLHRAFRDLHRLVGEYRKLLLAVKANAISATLVAEVEEAERAVEAEYLIEEIPNAINESLEGVERVVKIVQAMKEFSHPGTEQKQPADLNKSIESTLIVARGQWKRVAEVVTELDPGLPLVTCQVAEFNQAILNLVVNAADAIAEVVGDASVSKGTIKISTRRVEGWVEIRIQDSGIGIPESVQTRIFEPFFTTKPIGKGTGQGLAIVHDVIVGRHGGTIAFDSKPGQGTTFIVRLPINPN